MEYKELSSNPVGVVLQLVGAKWKILIVKNLLAGELRFSELKKSLGCTSKVLTACLKEMECDGIVVREKLDKQYNCVTYCLSDIGYTLKPVIDAMQKWGRDYKKLRKLMEKYKDT